jgi:hypothetical protein
MCLKASSRPDAILYLKSMLIPITSHSASKATLVSRGCSVQGTAKSLGLQTFTHFKNLKSAFRSSVEVRRTFKNLSSFTACVCQNCKTQQPPPVQSHSSLAVKVTCSMIYIWNMICNLYQVRKFPLFTGRSCHTSLNC